MIGDFNEVVDAFENIGEAPFDPNRCKIFKEWIFNNNLIDVFTDGPKFTWYEPKLSQYDIIMERLDRFLCNENWRITFFEANVSVIPRNYCDHHHLFLTLNKPSNGIKNRPFRFEAAWFTHVDFFKKFVQDNYNVDWCVNIDDFTHKIKNWNNEVFGHIRKRKKGSS